MESSIIGKPVVSGRFYPSLPQEIKNQIESFLGPKEEKIDALGCLLPHAGYIYSGKVAVRTLAKIKIRNNIILLGPNHTGYGPDYSIMTEGVWQTHLGEVKINSILAKKIIEPSAYLEEDSLAHNSEHSLEVELPILQYFKKDFEIVPIVFKSENFAELVKIGEEIGLAIQDLQLKDQVLLISSSDMTHYEEEAQARKKDQKAIGAILKLDQDKLREEVTGFNISMCGYAPTVVMLGAAKKLGAKKAQLVSYQTSADTTGDKSSVVGYAGLIIN
ncbi:MAG: AmmeMemoRadiSam system protein B [Candidatus Omnitrophica bacterium]|nr:AmmeMemoRadiSam system protein B [Candidatus Omnitrophota bacterium]